MPSVSQPVMTTEVGSESAYCKQSVGVTAPSASGGLRKKSPEPSGFIPSTPMSCSTSAGSTLRSKLS